MSSNRIDFKLINEAALSHLPAILARILPGGFYTDAQREYVVKNPRRADRCAGSFKIRVSGHRAGAWADFATGDKGGDVISLVAYVEGVGQFEAAYLLGLLLGIKVDPIWERVHA